MSSKLKPWLLLAVIFIVGVVTGSALTFGWVSHFKRPPAGAQQMGRHWMVQLVHRLNLTPDQQAKIQPILVDARIKIQSLHRDEVERGDQIFKTANDRIAALLAPLTPEQKVEFQKMENEREEMFSGHLRPWKPQREGPGGSLSGGPVDGRTPPPLPPASDVQTNAAPPAPQNP